MIGKACVALILCILLLSGCSEQGGSPLSELLEDRGYAATETGWTNALTDEQLAELEDAYQASVSSGYKGAKGEWLSKEVHYRLDGGDLTLILPDGKEISIGQSDFFSAENSDSGKNGSKPEAGNASSVAEWSGSLDDEQQAALDLAYESSVKDGYKGSKDAWLASEVKANYDHNGDVAVVFPDGTQITVPVSENKPEKADSKKSDAAKADAGKTENTTEDDVKPDEGSPSVSATKGEADIIVSRTEVSPGDKNVAVKVRIGQNPGVLGLTLSVSFDEKAMSLRSIENGDAFKGVLNMSHSKDLGNGCVISWDGVAVKDKDVRDGTIATLYFDLADGVAAGSYPLTVRVGDAVDNDLRPVEITVRDASVVVI